MLARLSNGGGTLRFTLVGAGFSGTYVAALTNGSLSLNRVDLASKAPVTLKEAQDSQAVLSRTKSFQPKPDICLQNGPAMPPTKFVSPQGGLTAVVLASGKEKGAEESESRVEIRGKKGAVLSAHDFSSPDGEHGYGVDEAQWTADSQFFVFRMRNSGGHMPMYAPVVFWSRRRNRFYQLDDYTADQTFSVSSPDRISMDTWPDMKPVTISLHDSSNVKATQLR